MCHGWVRQCADFLELSSNSAYTLAQPDDRLLSILKRCFQHLVSKSTFFQKGIFIKIPEEWIRAVLLCLGKKLPSALLWLYLFPLGNETLTRQHLIKSWELQVVKLSHSLLSCVHYLFFAFLIHNTPSTWSLPWDFVDPCIKVPSVLIEVTHYGKTEWRWVWCEVSVKRKDCARRKNQLWKQ
jgi:uncharacterized membrane protein YhdT